MKIHIAFLCVAIFAAPVRARAGACNGKAVADVLAEAQAKCCPARNHGAYVSCAAHVAQRAVKARRIRAACKTPILKAGCPAATTTTMPAVTTTSTSTTATTQHPTSTTAPPVTTTSTTAAPTTSTTTAPTTTSTTTTNGSPRHTTSTTAPASTTTSSTTAPTTSTTAASTTTSTTAASTTSTTAVATTSTTSAPGASSTTTTSSTIRSTTTTLPGPLPPAREICGNCIDDDGNGLTDFEDPACCPAGESFTMVVTRGRIRPRGAVSRLRLKAILARIGLETVNPLQDDVFLQLRPVDGTDIFCARMPADKFMRMHGEFKFWDHAHKVASARHLDDFAVQVRKDASVRARTLGKRAQLQTPAPGIIQVTVGFLDPTSDAGNSCSSALQPFRTVGGQLVAP